MEEKQDNNERDELLKKIEECPSKRVREALKDSLNKENSTSESNE